MGEARRRKAFDPDYGKSRKPKIEIATSPVTGNFLVLHDRIIFDSALLRADAEMVAAWLEKEVALEPLPRNWHRDLATLQRWLENRSTPAPKVEAIGIDYYTGARVVVGGERNRSEAFL